MVYDVYYIAIPADLQASDTTSSPPSSERVSRCKSLTDEEKAKIQAMQKPSDMEYSDAWILQLIEEVDIQSTCCL